MSLKGLSYGDKLVDELFAHSSKMEKMYEAISNLLAAGSNNDGKYSKIIALYNEHSQWFEKAKAFGQRTICLHEIKMNKAIKHIYFTYLYVFNMILMVHLQL